MKIRSGKYLFKGYTIKCLGYHAPDHKVVWEATDKDNNAVAHGYSLREVEFRILEDDFEEVRCKLSKDCETFRDERDGAMKHWREAEAKNANLLRLLNKAADALQHIYDRECTDYGTGDTYDEILAAVGRKEER